MGKILITGASGQIGSDLTLELRKRYGNERIIATDIQEPSVDIKESGPFEILDVIDREKMYNIIKKYNISQIYHLAALLSGTAEEMPQKAWHINMQSLMNVLELAREEKLERIFFPSSIAVFGPSTPRQNTPQTCVMDPNSVYGISKLAGERWVQYYYEKFGVDTRSLRYPGLISYKAEAGGGTTDYAVEIFYEAFRKGEYTCFLKEDAALPMQFMPDAIKATIDLMEADSSQLSIRSSYNVAGISFTPAELVSEIRKHMPELKVNYDPDFRQAIAESWPCSIDDTIAREDWSLKNEYDLERMTKVMLEEIGKKLK